MHIYFSFDVGCKVSDLKITDSECLLHFSHLIIILQVFSLLHNTCAVFLTAIITIIVASIS